MVTEKLNRVGNVACVRHKAAVFELARQTTIEDFVETAQDAFAGMVTEPTDLVKIITKVAEIAREKDEQGTEVFHYASGFVIPLRKQTK